MKTKILPNKYRYNVKRSLYAFWFHRYRYIYDLSKSEFSDIYYSIMKNLKHQILTNPHGVEFPFFFGRMASQWIDTTLSKYRNPLYNKEIKIRYIIKEHMRFNKYVSHISFVPCGFLKEASKKNTNENGEIFKEERISKRRLLKRMYYINYLKEQSNKKDN